MRPSAIRRDIAALRATRAFSGKVDTGFPQKMRPTKKLERASKARSSRFRGQVRELGGVVHLRAAEPGRDPRHRNALRIARRPVLEGEIARRRRAGIEVLVEPGV